MASPKLYKRDRDEILRSAEEARKCALTRAEVERYLRPPADAAYPLEYAFYLLGNVNGKHVLDLGCGTGENIVPLARRGAHVVGIDISPDLISLAERRLVREQIGASVSVGSAYDTGFPDESVDVIFCIALHEHPLTRDELERLSARFKVEGARHFRLPFIPLMERAQPSNLAALRKCWKADRWIFRHFQIAQRYATNVTLRLRKEG